MVIFASTLIAGGAAAFVAIGPTPVLQILGLGVDDGQKASQFDLTVERMETNHAALDFLIPEPSSAAEPKSDINAELDKRLKGLHEEIEEVVRTNKDSGLSLADVEKLLERSKKEMTQEIQKEIQREHLRVEALRLEENHKDEEGQQLQEINTRQMESKSVIVDESGARDEPANSVAQISEDLSANDRFLVSAPGLRVETSTSQQLLDKSHTVVQGTIIPAVLETAIDSELPGNVRAQVTEPVFSFDGSRILVPAGTMLIGTFNNDVDIEQRRVLISWNRAVTPEGKSIGLASTGTDPLGRAGTEGDVDNRYVKKIGAAAFISATTSLPSIISGLTSMRSPGGGDTPLNRRSASGNIDAVGRDVSNIAGATIDEGRGILDKYLSLPPILRVPQGREIQVFVNRDLVIR
ncbi:conjugal transfer protein [Rhizobium leguminosarum]|nr:conjugal transfer protein [Rhizobium leguminosarum]